MAVRMVVGVTDRDWFEHLRARPHLGEANGAGSLSEMRRCITRYRRDADPRADFAIGCRVLTDAVFWSEKMWLPPPAS